MEKDLVLSLLSRKFNTAAFVSIGKDKKIRYSNFLDSDSETYSIPELINMILMKSKTGKFGVRTFKPDKPNGNPFLYGNAQDKIYEVTNKIESFLEEGYIVIISETIEQKDGGIAGVKLGNLVELVPESTPRSVEEEGVCILPYDIWVNIMKKIYPQVDFKVFDDLNPNTRVEFTLHSSKQGIKNENIVIWELTEVDDESIPDNIKIKTDNRFAEFIGNKAFGLLVMDTLNENIPKTTVVGRNVPLFRFGKETSKDIIIRTAPNVKKPGKYYSGNFTDPFKLMEGKEDITSVLYQTVIEAKYSGAALIDANSNKRIIEGVEGNGDLFMLAEKEINNLPKAVLDHINIVADRIILTDHFDKFSFEWVFDGRILWIVQLNTFESEFSNTVIYPGNPDKWINYDCKTGLEKLRDIVENIDSNTGIILNGKIGITSHMGDILRQAKIPPKIYQK